MLRAHPTTSKSHGLVGRSNFAPLHETYTCKHTCEESLDISTTQKETKQVQYLLKSIFDLISIVYDVSHKSSTLLHYGRNIQTGLFIA